jgi:hypothetical protein
MLLDPVLLDYLVRLEQNMKLQEVEKDRLVRQIRRARERQERFYLRGLAWLVERLLCWGQNLKKRSGLHTEVCVLPSANYCQCN